MGTISKRILWQNIIKFVIGAILLGFSIQYLQTHPAEKTSIVSSFEILYEKMIVLTYKLTGRDREGVNAKNDMKRKFEELIHTATNSNCLSGEELQGLQDIAHTLEQEPTKGFSEKSIEYNNTGYYYKELIEQKCTVIDLEQTTS